MRTQKRTDALKFSLVFPALLLSVVAASSHAGSNAMHDGDGARISVTAVAGEVDFTMAGNAVAVAPNSTVLLPARIVTGHDGSVGLTQAGTNVSVANDTDVEIPAEAVDGNLIARLVQHRGNVFYDVAPRDLGKLRVETPLLVAVIKGTQFNVAVQPDSTTISLFEGRLEIRTPDGSDVVQLDAGEIAIRALGDGAIRVVGMDDERAEVPRAGRPAFADAAARAARSDLGLASRVVVDDGLGAPADTRGTGVVAKPTLDVLGGEGAVPASTTLGGAIEIGPVDLALDARVEVGSATVDVGLDAAVDLGGAAVDVGLDTAVDLGGAAVDVGLDTAVDLGGAAVDVGLDTDLDLGAGAVELDATLDTGTTVVDAGLDAGLDLGGALDVDLGVDLGGGIELELGASDDTAPAPAPAPPPGLLNGLLGLP
jgi:hypothetical protein